jgi:uncharacterized protein (TIGR00299 family) protein
MRIAYLDCFAGISGDMFLGALLDAGVQPQVLHDAAAALNLGAHLKIETVDRSGISSTKVHVLDRGHLAESINIEQGSFDSFQDQSSRADEPLQHEPQTQHHHKTGHPHTLPEEDSHTHTHNHSHSHGRSLSVITNLIHSSELKPEVKVTASRIFDLLGNSEAKIHNVPVEQIHFHEVGAVDAIVDIVCAAAGIHELHIDTWFASPINIGGGMVDCAHGRFPVPAPATADLLRGMPTYSADIQRELVTPTGAAILRALAPTFGPQPPMRVESIGYGAGSRNPQGFPNVLRLSVGDQDPANSSTDRVTVLETAIDDLSPQILAHVTESALAQGALDVMSTSVQMKKGRLGTLITILTDESHAPALERLLLCETSTLGVRIRHDRRSTLDRTHTPVQTPYGEIRIKIGSRAGEELNAAPEFEDCRAAASKHEVPVKQVMQSAITAYHNSKAN